MFSSNRRAWRPYKEVCHSGATGFPEVCIRGPGLQIGDNLRRFPAPRRRVYPLYTQDKWIIVKMFSSNRGAWRPYYIARKCATQAPLDSRGYGYLEGVFYRATPTVTRDIR